MTLKMKGIIEGLLFASGDEGMTIHQLAKIVNMTKEDVQLVIDELMYDYEHEQRGINLLQSHDIYHLTTKPEHNAYYKKMLQNPRKTRMSQAVLETLAIIAYKQPITKIEMEEIRGVNSDYAVQTLLARSFIEEVGRKDTIGRPKMYGTTKEFLTYFGLATLEALPPLPENIDEQLIDEETNLFFERFKEEAL